MLYDPGRHEPVQPIPWDESRVLEAIHTIVQGTEDRFDPESGWAVHPLDRERELEPPMKMMYLGASGVIWALHHLEAAGVVTLRRDYRPTAHAVYRAYLEQPDEGDANPGYFCGEAGILLVAHCLAPSEATADRLFELVRENAALPANELLYGTPGLLVAALHMADRTGEARWNEVASEGLERLIDGMEHRADIDAWLWSQRFDAHPSWYLGAAHGFGGNAWAVLRGARLLDPERLETFYRRCLQTLEQTVMIEGDCANWRPSAYSRPGGEKWLVQWCHGAPGMVTSFAAFPRACEARMDRLLEMAGEMTWQAGPLAKGPGLCHGTAGNGEAFLALYRRTGEACWLERARAFAMHAIAQEAAMRAEHGTGRDSLWTGDPGVALYLSHCLREEFGLPGLECI